MSCTLAFEVPPPLPCVPQEASDRASDDDSDDEDEKPDLDLAAGNKDACILEVGPPPPPPPRLPTEQLPVVTVTDQPVSHEQPPSMAGGAVPCLSAGQ